MVNIPNTNPRAQVIITSLAHKDDKGRLQTISFFPYDFDIDDSYKPDWGTYDAFGRMDPIMTYKRTTRDVNLSFNVVAENATTAFDNFKNLQILIKCLYPTYQAVDLTTTQILQEKRDALIAQQAEEENLNQQSLNDFEDSERQSIDLQPEIQQIEAQMTQQAQINSDFGVKVMNKSPLFQISFMNLLTQQQFVAAITSFKHKMKFDAADTSFSKDGKVIPGEFSINIGFKVLHTDIPGNRLNYGF